MEPTDQSTVTSSGASSAANGPRRGRPSRILLAAVLTELVVIAAIGNQSVVHTLRKNLDTHDYADYTRGALNAATTFNWRFAAENGQPTHVWAAQFAAIGALVVLTSLGVLAVGRGVVTFGRVFVAVWAVVAAVTPVAIMVRNVVVVPSAPGPRQSRIGQSVYGYDDFGPVLVAGLALGLVVGLLAALIAVITRTKPRPIGSYDGEDAEYLDTDFANRANQPYAPPPWGVEPGADAPTSVQPRAYPLDAPPPAPPWSAPAEPQPAWGGEQSPADARTEALPAYAPATEPSAPAAGPENTPVGPENTPVGPESTEVDEPAEPSAQPAQPAQRPVAAEPDPDEIELGAGDELHPPAPEDRVESGPGPDATAQLPRVDEDDPRSPA